jgi:hypothetical protein
MARNFGWVNDPEAVAETTKTFSTPAFGDTPAGKRADLPKSVYLWHAYRKLGIPIVPKNQLRVGSCVAFGYNGAAEDTSVVEMAMGDPEEFTHYVEEVTYGGSRVQIGGGRISGDGSIGAWAAKFLVQYGLVPRGVYGRYDLREYSEERCREFGRVGVPAELQEVTRKFPVKDVSPVRSWDEFKRAIASGYAVAICSDQGFEMRRDDNGVCAPRGTWMHCMYGNGYHTFNNGREVGHIENSWGANAHTGPLGPGEPCPSGFYADAKVIDRMLRQGDSHAIAGVTGFPAREISWVI